MRALMRRRPLLREAVVDANFVIAVMFKDHAFHNEAIREWGALDAGYLPFVAACEIAYFLLKNKMSLSPLQEVLTDPKLHLLNDEQSDLLYAVENAEKVKSYDDFNDMVIIGAAKRMGMEVISFDRKMREKVGK